MEIKQYIGLIRKWRWFLLLGIILGGIGGLVFSFFQTTIYEATTRVMVSRAFQESSAGYSVTSDLQLAKTYVQLFTTEPTLELLNKKLGFYVDAENIQVKEVTGSLLMEVSVQDDDPELAAHIANTLVEVFIDYNDSLQSGRYETSEQNLKSQISDVEEQITRLQDELDQAEQDVVSSQEQEAEKRIEEIKIELAKIEPEILALQSQMNALVPSGVTVDTQVFSSTLTIPTPNPNLILLLSPESQEKYYELQLRLDELVMLRKSYNDTYINLVVNGAEEKNTDKWIARRDQIEATLTQYQQIHSDLLNNYENIRLARLNNTPNVAQVEPALVPEEPIQPRPLLNGLLGAASGLFITATLAFLFEYLDDTLKTPEDIQQYLNLPVIGLIGETNPSEGPKQNQHPGVFVTKHPLSPVTEAFRTLRTNLEFASVDIPLSTLIVTSTSPSEGKSTVAVNLAVVIAQGGKKVVLIDTDLRRPSIHRYLELPNRRGLSDLFRDPAQLPHVIQTWDNLPITIITSGPIPPNPAELLDSKGMEQIIDELKESYDLVIIDSPPAVVVDPIVLSAKVDGVLMVIEPGKTRIDAAQVVLEQLHRAGARVVGVVMNPISRKTSHYYTRYKDFSNYQDSQSYGSILSEEGPLAEAPKTEQEDRLDSSDG